MGCCRSRAKGSASKTAAAPERAVFVGKDLESGNAWICITEDVKPLFEPLPEDSFPRKGVTGILSKHGEERRNHQDADPSMLSFRDRQKMFEDVSKPSRSPLDDKVAVILDLSAKAQVFKAHALLEELLQSSDSAVCAEMLQRLPSLPVLTKMQSAYKHLQNAIDLTMTPALRTDVTWTSCTVKDPKISKDFVLNFSMRMADSSEFEAGGPSSQIIVRGEVSRFPVSLVHFMLLQTEADLARKEWMKDCESIRAWPGGETQLFRVLVQVLLAPMLLPFRLQETFLRTFSVCDQSPFRSGELGRSSQSGVVLMEANPPQGQTEYEGWTLPAPAHKRALTLRGTLKMLYATPTADPNAVDVFAAARVGVPVSPYIVPLELFKRILAELMRESFSRIKEKVIDNWQAYDFDAREAANPAFYEQFRRMHEIKANAG